MKKALGFGFESEIIDARDLASDRTIVDWMYKGGKLPEKMQKWKEIVQKADGLIFVIPEYNHGYPGEFKIVFDMIFNEYKRKPVSVCAVSDGMFGGARMLEQVWSLTIAAHMVPTTYYVNFPFVDKMFDEKGEVKDPATRSITESKMQKMLEETEWFAKLLKGAE
ncbi:MAG: hypothetical protein US52_C0014G0005 [candidate division WS6 bacterium GW2011_GWA2_37_6]|uniref:NADPH-dependent FMN reductase-like domain-containing protein n=1 Tax=candidate division WS6 bacterium GW2011_GWA2_37_6 TaxID=1619087 RepID=A0A0G0HBF1_9BACT|nr:MAG: hypothetical protein US52_C0014G0005 [candidate division WS6 bacterium GW2011_GWA2_37_6]